MLGILLGILDQCSIAMDLAKQVFGKLSSNFGWWLNRSLRIPGAWLAAP